jgi:SAM-dependent methyltransferase
MTDQSKNNYNRLKSEAEFENARVQARLSGGERPRGKFGFLMRRARQDYEKALSDVSEKNVAVIGCSTGGVFPLAKSGAFVIGLDISESALVHLSHSVDRQGLSKNIKILAMDAEQPGFRDNSIDILCCTGVLHHLDIEKSLSRWSCILKENGRLVMMEPCAYNPLVALYRILTPRLRTPDEHPLRFSDIKILERYFYSVKITGYAMLSLFALALQPIPYVNKFTLPMAKAADRLDFLLLKYFPWLAMFCRTIIIEAENPKKCRIMKSRGHFATHDGSSMKQKIAEAFIRTTCRLYVSDRSLNEWAWRARTTKL